MMSKQCEISCVIRLTNIVTKAKYHCFLQYLWNDMTAEFSAVKRLCSGDVFLYGFLNVAVSGGLPVFFMSSNKFSH